MITTVKQNPLFTILSDTHGVHRQLTLPKSKYLLLCGDFTLRSRNVEDVIQWIDNQPIEKIISILGNHESLFPEQIWKKLQRTRKEIHCLNGKLLDIDDFQFIGSNYKFHINEKEMKKRNPTKPLICLSHEPPFNIMDYGIRKRQILTGEFFHAGSHKVKEFIEKYQPSLHCFGHCHSSHGIITIGKTLHVNGAIVDDNNMLAFKPIQIQYDYQKKQFIPLEQRKCITLSQFIKQLSEHPFDYLQRSREYQTTLQKKRKQFISTL